MEQKITKEHLDIHLDITHDNIIESGNYIDNICLFMMGQIRDIKPWIRIINETSMADDKKEFSFNLMYDVGKLTTLISITFDNKLNKKIEDSYKKVKEEIIPEYKRIMSCLTLDMFLSNIQPRDNKKIPQFYY